MDGRTFDSCEVCGEKLPEGITPGYWECLVCEKRISDKIPCACVAMCWCQSNYAVCRKCVERFDVVACDVCGVSINEELAGSTETFLVDGCEQRLCSAHRGKDEEE